MIPAEIATAVVAVLTPLGGGVAWIWAQIDKRITGLEGKVAACEAREDDGLKRRMVQLTVIEILWQRLDQPEPGSPVLARSEEHTSELQSLMRISYAVFCLKKKNKSNSTKMRA